MNSRRAESRWHHRPWWQVVLYVGLGHLLAWYLLTGGPGHTVRAEPPKLSPDREAFQRVWSTNRVVLVGLGDSITAGFGATKKHSYFDLLAENNDGIYADLKGCDLRHVFPALETLNLSISYTVSEE